MILSLIPENVTKVAQFEPKPKPKKHHTSNHPDIIMVYGSTWKWNDAFSAEVDETEM